MDIYDKFNFLKIVVKKRRKERIIIMSLLDDHQLLFENIKKQNKNMVNLITSHKTVISSEVIFISLYINDLNTLKLLSDHLNNNIKYHGKFFLRSQELGYILQIDNVELIDYFKNFIHREILCYTLNIAISKK
jgi:hypothetical protein